VAEDPGPGFMSGQAPRALLGRDGAVDALELGFVQARRVKWPRRVWDAVDPTPEPGHRLAGLPYSGTLAPVTGDLVTVVRRCAGRPGWRIPWAPSRAGAEGRRRPD